MLSLIDTHCHLDMDAYHDDLSEVLHRAEKNHIDRVISVGIDLSSSRAAIDIAKRFTSVYATVGVHPHDVKNINNDTYDKLVTLAAENTNVVVGYGEIGLDYVKLYSPREVQKKRFIEQLHLAIDLNLPVIIHDREAHEDLISILKTTPQNPKGGVIHCFSGNLSMAQLCIEMGYYISIPGVVTFKNAVELQEVARKINIEHMLLETDGPFLAPHPFRGKRNEPSYVLNIAEYIAKLRSMDTEQLAMVTTKNANRLFCFEKTEKLL